MPVKKGDIVTRKSYEHDTLFKVMNIKGNICYLKGLDVRLYADSEVSDLSLATEEEIEELKKEEKEENDEPLDRSAFFYLPGKVLHLDGDNEYLGRCLAYYKKHNIFAVGKRVSESEVASKIRSMLQEYNPDIVIITGHDAYFRKKGKMEDIHNYNNKENFVKDLKD